MQLIKLFRQSFCAKMIFSERKQTFGQARYSGLTQRHLYIQVALDVNS